MADNLMDAVRKAKGAKRASADQGPAKKKALSDFTGDMDSQRRMMMDLAGGQNVPGVQTPAGAAGGGKGAQQGPQTTGGVVGAVRGAAQTAQDARDPQQDPEWLKAKQIYETSQNPEEKRLALLKMRYREARLRGDRETQNRLATEIQALDTSLGQADIFNERLDQSGIDARDAFRRATDISVARQIRGVEGRAQALIDRLGLSEGMAAQTLVGAEAMLGGLGIEKMANFDAQMETIMQAQEMGFLQNQFDFFNEIVRMRFNTDFEKEIMSHRAKLEKDIQRQQQWGNAITEIFKGLGGSLLGGPIGSGVAASAGLPAGFGETPNVPSLQEGFSSGLRIGG